MPAVCQGTAAVHALASLQLRSTVLHVAKFCTENGQMGAPSELFQKIVAANEENRAWNLSAVASRKHPESFYRPEKRVKPEKVENS